MRKIKEVLRLHWDLGLGNRAVARSLSVSHSTVIDLSQYSSLRKTAFMNDRESRLTTLARDPDAAKGEPRSEASQPCLEIDDKPCTFHHLPVPGERTYV